MIDWFSKRRTFPQPLDSAKTNGMLGPLPAHTTFHALEETILHFRPRHASEVASSLDTAIALDDGTGHPWTVRIRRGRLSMRRGIGRKVETTIHSDPLTLIGVVRGTRSGVEAFLRGRLKVRGNLSLALKLDGLFDRGDPKQMRPIPRRAHAAGVDTFYLDAGVGPPVVLLHGLGATNASMLTTLSDLSRDFRVIAPDLPGFGDSGKPSARYDAEFFSRWLDEFLGAIAVDSAHLVGNSMGGRVAIETALRYPGRVDRLALLAPAMAFRRGRQLAPLVRVLDPRLGKVPLVAPRISTHAMLRLIFSNPRRIRRTWYDAAVDEFHRVFSTPEGRVAFYAAARAIYLDPPFGRDGLWERMTRLDRPALFVWGDADWLVPSGFGRHVKRAVPGCESIVFEDCGHVPQFERPDVVHPLVRDFLTRAQADDLSRRRGASMVP
jgi:pimeloyl-ACP methyl ester carboxylesterase